MIISKFLNPKKQETIVCFFCNIEAKADEAFTLEYKALDGNGKVNTCPMCAGMLDNMMEMRDITYDD